MVQDRPATLDVTDYEAIEAAVMETERGRWFLAEYARRQRSAEMAELRALLAQIDAKLPSGARPTPPAVEAPPPALRIEVAGAPPVPAPPLRLQKPASGLTLAMIDAMPAIERLALFA
ncbi:MAG: hypothetical protein KGQ37_09085 [Hyphomicrobiales bacterium]|nr:hypothetical protein [Hyphomicrobiales bacterium]